MANQMNTDQPPQKHGVLKRFSNAIVQTMENGFYRLGKLIGQRPWVVIGCCVLVSALCGLGILRLTNATAPEKLWVPIGADVIAHKNWVEQTFPSKTRVSFIIVTDNNVLTPTSLSAILNIYLDTTTVATSDGTKLDDICLKVQTNCLVNSLLELWSYNKTTIQALSQSEILDAVNTVTVSPMYKSSYDIKTVLGERTTNSSGSVTRATAMLLTWFLQGDDDVVDKVKSWELKIIDIGKKGHTNLDDTFVFTSRSFSDEGGGALQGDVVLLSSGYFLLILFVTLVLGRFNLVEQRVGLAFAGILCIGMAIAVSFGLASLCGVQYTPLHSILPFLLLGIGVDDMFVIVAALNNLTVEEREKDIPEKVGIILKHAGLSITVTSLTDMVAFGIGATTILPALQSFCIFAFFGIFALYILQATCFTACLALDLRRMSSLRDACCCWYTHRHWHPNKCSTVEFIPLFFKKIMGPFLMKLPVKIIVIVVTLALFGVNIYGVINLKQDFDSSWFLPTDGYAYKYFQTRRRYFPDDGARGAIYCGNIDYFNSKTKMDKIYTDVSTNEYIYTGTVDSWFKSFTAWLGTTSDPTVTSQLDANKYPLTSNSFDNLCFDFVNRTETRLSRYMKFATSSGGKILASQIPFQHKNLPDSQTEVKAMDTMRSVIANTFSESQCFPYARRYLGTETNKVIQTELYRNLGLAFGCVFIVTLILIANLWTSLMVFTCVVFTLVDVGGCMYFWGLTIDTVTGIILILAIGLAVDCSAHIGHMFMTVKGTRLDRTLETLSEMGPPVFNGGFSTLLAFILLAGSNSYVFTTFFKVFLLVVSYGLFHGLVYLPVLLSWIGPSPYLSADRDYRPEEVEIDPELRFSSGNSADKNQNGAISEPQPDYGKPALIQNGIAPNGTIPYIPPPDYTPPLSPKRSLPAVQT